MNLENHISELLYHHDCVIVADMGGFVGNYRPAYLHPAHHTISPPSKKIAFNANLTNNDGLLATHIAAKLNVSYVEACNMIRDFKEDSFTILNKGEQLLLDKIGVLYLDHEKNIQFNADNSRNYLLESFGLSAVHAPVVNREFEKDTIVKSFEKTFEKNERKSWWRLLEVIPAAAAIALLLLNMPGFDQTLKHNLNNFNPINHFEPRVEPPINKPVVNTITPVQVSPLKETANARAMPASSEPIDKSAVSVNENPTPPKSETDAPIAAATKVVIADNEISNGNFYIVAGCFKIEANAENFKNELISQGYNASIIGNYKGLQVVSCAAAPTQLEAETALQNIKQTLEAGAWIMKK